MGLFFEVEIEACDFLDLLICEIILSQQLALRLWVGGKFALDLDVLIEF